MKAHRFIQKGETMIEVISLSLDEIYMIAGGGEVSCKHKVDGHEIKIMSEARYNILYGCEANKKEKGDV